MPLCFDLDGTLGHFGGGYVLLREALGELWGQPPGEAELRACRGSTDWEIVDELHRLRFGDGLAPAMYEAFEGLCLARFEAAFHPAARQPEAFRGILAGLRRLADLGHPVWLVSGNVPRVLAFKARALGIDPAVPLLGSLPGLDRAGLLRRALAGCRGPHLYVGDRPHDRRAADGAGVPFLGVGHAVPGDHPLLAADAEAEQLVAMVVGLRAGS
jgi:phosphoglycolate phosphatase-like HAD superfamily hydrolase